MPPRHRPLAALAALTFALPLAVSPLAQAAPTTTSATISTTADAVRTDRVHPTVEWGACPPSPYPDYFENAPGVECATVELPLDYDEPYGAQVEVFVAKHPATDPDARLGSLFVNPGGPGVPGSMMALSAPLWYTPDVLARFDVVAMDPRGTGASTPVYCHASTRKQVRHGRGFASSLPHTNAEKARYLNAAKKQAMGCSGEPLAAAMSTAEVARDMDVLRRTLGDDKLTYSGTSYGSYLGQVYANMFPDRVRAVAIDGVLDPVAWAGTPATAEEPVTLRIRSGEGAWDALQAAFALCTSTGTSCLTGQNPQAVFDRVVARVQSRPVEVVHPFLGVPVRLDYGTFVNAVLGSLYETNAPVLVDAVLAWADAVTDPGTPPAAKARALARVNAAKPAKLPPNSMEGYDNMNDAFWSVLCSDSLNPVAPRAWEPAIEARTGSAPHFAASWGWQSATCATRFWTADDEDAWRGPFTRQTAAPVLVVGNRHDPATPYSGAVEASRLLPNSALLTVEEFGHGAYLYNQCATAAIDSYLLTGRTPSVTTCASEQEHFTPRR